MTLARAADELGAGNGALAHLGEGRLTSLSQNAPRARYISQHFGTVRDALLRRHNWNFASHFETLSADPTLPAGTFANAYPLPSDCLKVRSVDGAIEDDWAVEARTKVVSGAVVSVNVLSTDIAAPRINYTRAVYAVAAWDALFLTIFEYLLAGKIAPLLNRTNGVELEAKGEALMPVSKRIDQREAARSRIRPDPSYISVRRG